MALPFEFLAELVLVIIVAIILAIAIQIVKKHKKQMIAELQLHMDIKFDDSMTQGVGTYLGRRIIMRFDIVGAHRSAYPRMIMAMSHESYVVGQTRFVSREVAEFASMAAPAPDEFIEANFAILCTHPDRASILVTPRFARAMREIAMHISGFNANSSYGRYVLREVEVDEKWCMIVLAGHLSSVDEILKMLGALFSLADSLDDRTKAKADIISQVQASRNDALTP